VETEPSAAREPSRLRLLVAIFAIALLLRLPVLGHGLPGLYVPDTHSVRNALGMLQKRDLVPASNEFSSYPYLYSYACLPLFVGDYAWARVSGEATSTAAYQESAQAHLERFHRLGRVLSALFGAAAAAAAAAGGLALFGRRGGWLCGIVASVSPMPYLLSLHERPWSMVHAFTALSAAAAVAALVRSGTSSRSSARFLWLASAAAGAAAASHQLGAAAFALVAGAVLLHPGLTLARRGMQLFACGALFLGVAVIGYPFLIRYGLTGAPKTSVTSATDVSLGGQGLVLSKFDGKYTAEALTGVFTSELTIPLLALLGAWVVFRRSRSAAGTLLFLVIPITLFFSRYTGTHARYFMVAWPAVWLLAGAACADLWHRGAALRALVILSLALPTAGTLRTAQILLEPDTRGEAEDRARRELPEGAVVAVEPYGPSLPSSVAWLERLAAAKNGALTRREQMALARREPGGFAVMPLERFCVQAVPEGYSRGLLPLAEELWPSTKTVAKLLVHSGARYLVRVDRFPAQTRSDEVAVLTEDPARARLLWEVDPSRGESPAPEALLPFEPRLGLWALLSVSRPGPRIRVYELLDRNK